VSDRFRDGAHLRQDSVQKEKCPYCGGEPLPDHTFLGKITFNCGDCGERVGNLDRDDCMECGKTLAGRDALCYSCEKDMEDDQQ